ncbi:MAG: precorrin-3B C(17)-methyltransferase [Clostridiales bacterium]|nr:precorrin-3B C(17)-methyltransferase [Clostridiales bacterium]
MIHVIGIGAGSTEGRTLEAVHALHNADIFVGYTTYIDLLRGDYPDKSTFETGMRGEKERCAEALQLSRSGKKVALCCSGDAQVYGMAALLLEMAEETDEIHIVAGVTAALSGAAVLGAPLSGDFVVISLSDLMTPWDRIQKRLQAAALGDFVVILYNPYSKTRTVHLSRACDILLEHRSSDTVCGWVRNIAREGQEKRILTLAELRESQLDMFTTVFIGSSETIVHMGRMLTPRGYRL